MKLLRNTEIKDYRGTNRMHAIFYCPNCKAEIEKPKKYGLMSKSCGCRYSFKGKTINGFFIVDDLGESRRKVLAKCPNCKTDNVHLMQSIKNNIIKSCGCVKPKMKHGLSRTKLYSILNGIKQRVGNKNSPSYKNYGKRGIKLCKEWEDVEVFTKWALENGYRDNLSIDRIDNDGNYEPSNCRWTTSEIQSRNTRRLQSNNTSGYRGVSYDKARKLFVAKITIDNKAITLGSNKEAKKCAEMRDKFIYDNNLEHTKS